ncbi:hypothetical protein B0A48_01593 [Cryoendolithus antarcticus]|uniref:DUF7730 domain-containing protein n=1 Tax=Cryoendolithus antarcticus TaxID=1507870 RepID=A0A1V8TPT9_9PEZI|nr:hypothetical protein B0A48_01593 [Cryoendolithus antarcticus]
MADLSTFLTADTGFWGDLALKVLVNASPSVQWANRIAEPWQGLPFGPYLHGGRPRRQRSLTVREGIGMISGWMSLARLGTREVDIQIGYEQEDSPFFALLPFDVRMIIYDMVLGGMTFHVSAGDNHSRIFHLICQDPSRITQTQQHDRCHQSQLKRPSSAPRDDSKHATGLLPWLTTCRRAYSETIDLLYSANRFEFTQIHTSFRFLTRMIPQPRLPALRHIVLKMAVPRHPDLNSRTKRDWQDLFDLFSKQMTGLQSLQLTLGMLESVKQQIRETADSDGVSWIRPMMIVAVDGYAKRRCKVYLAIEGVRHDLVHIWRSVPEGHSEVFPEMKIDGACTRLHQRIRMSLGGLG